MDDHPVYRRLLRERAASDAAERQALIEAASRSLVQIHGIQQCSISSVREPPNPTLKDA